VTAHDFAQSIPRRARPRQNVRHQNWKPSMINKIIFKEHKETVAKVIDFFTAQFSKKDLYERIKDKCKDNPFSAQDPNRELKHKLGYLTINDYLYYYSDEAKESKKGIPLAIVERVINRLCEKGILFSQGFVFGDVKHAPYQGNEAIIKFLTEKDILDNYFYGFEYIIKKYQNSVVKIEVETEKGLSLGTGFIILLDKLFKPFIVTNKHVAQYKNNLKIISNDNKIFDYEKILLSDNEDIAIIILKEIDVSQKYFHFLDEIEILQEIVTIGYPRVAMTRESYQLSHKGEINSFVQDYSGNNLFILSAKTSPGNSGGPVLNEFGMVIGMTTQDFFENNEEAIIQTSYAAAIPSTTIKNFISHEINKAPENFIISGVALNIIN
jgi:V8-like Glu-specific endopeptidase